MKTVNKQIKPKPFKRLKRLLYLMYRKEGIQITDIRFILEEKRISINDDLIEEFISSYENEFGA